MSKTVAQIFATNPTTVVADTDLYYLVQSPYTPGTDAAITGASLKAAFGGGGTISPGLINQLAYYAVAGSTLSGLSTLANGALVTSAAGLPSISQTLPSAVQANITSLGTITSIGTPLGGAFGGTGVNNGASTITLGGNINTASSFATSGAFAVTQTYTGITNITFPTTGTLATTSQLITSPLTTKGDIWVWTTTNARLPVAAGDGKILQVSSAAAAGLAYSTPTYPSASGGAGVVLISDGTNNTYTTTTYPATNAINTIMYASSANVLGSIAAANNGTLITSATGVPSWLANGTTGQVLTATTGSPPSWETSPGVTPAALTETNDTNITLTLGGTPLTALLQAVSITAGWTGQLSLARGGTNANLTASNGGIFYSTASAAAVLAGTATAGQLLISGASTTPAWTTTTYPATNAINTLLYASAANVMGALATANSSILVTNGSGVPSWSTTLPSGLSATNLSLTTPTLGAATATSLAFSPTTGGIIGTTAADNAGAGKVGEVISSVIPLASAVSLVNLTSKDMTSISLTAGDWDVWGNIFITYSIGGGIIIAWTNTTSATKPDNSLVNEITFTTGTQGNTGMSVPMVRQNVSSPTTVYISANVNFASGTATMCGGIYARRRR
jgi:hypothetical protein